MRKERIPSFLIWVVDFAPRAEARARKKNAGYGLILWEEYHHEEDV